MSQFCDESPDATHSPAFARIRTDVTTCEYCEAEIAKGPDGAWYDCDEPSQTNADAWSGGFAENH